MARKQKRKGKIFAADRPIGCLFVVLPSLLGLLFLTVVAVAVFSSLRVPGEQGRQFQELVEKVRADWPDAVIAGVALLALLLVLLHLWMGVAMMKGRKWAFMLAVMLAVPSLFARNGFSMMEAVVLLYAILRLTGAVGPKPT